MNTSDVAVELRRRILEQGPITFAEFMEVALYWPAGGYYATRQAFGAGGDFYTAPLTHPVFGALIARQLHHTWTTMRSPAPFWVVELGAGSGRLAADVTAHAPVLGAEFAEALRYVTVDVQPDAEGGRGLQWVRADGVPFRGLSGVVLANELLDAMPVHRVAMEGGSLREVYVDVSREGPRPSGVWDPDASSPGFQEVLDEPSTPALADRLATLGVSLPDGYRTEVNLGIDPWMQAVACALDAGYVLLIDYGHQAADYYGAGRHRGMLRCYYRHTLNADPYLRVGEQDMGAHVEFTSVLRAAETAGLTPLGFTTQAEFLRDLGLNAYRTALQEVDISPALRAANLRAMEQLVDPDGMGGFKVLTLCKGVPGTPLGGFTGLTLTVRPREVPLATAVRVPLGVTEASAMPSWEELLR